MGRAGGRGPGQRGGSNDGLSRDKGVASFQLLQRWARSLYSIFLWVYAAHGTRPKAALLPPRAPAVTVTLRGGCVLTLRWVRWAGPRLLCRDQGHADVTTPITAALLPPGTLLVLPASLHTKAFPLGLWTKAGSPSGDCRHADVATPIAAALLSPGTLHISKAQFHARPKAQGPRADASGDFLADTATAIASASLSFGTLLVSPALVHAGARGAVPRLVLTLCAHGHTLPAAPRLAALLVSLAHVVVQALV